MDLSELPAHSVRRHPWEEVRFQFFFRVLSSLELGPSAAVLDVGAGDAWFAERLVERTAIQRIVCWDTGYTPEFLAARPLRRGERLELSTERPTGRFDLVLLLDVLEHVEDDVAFLEEFVRENLAVRGHVLISVPAWPLLFSSHDVRLHHYRRYTPAAARRLLGRAALEITRSAGLFHSLLLPRAVQVAREHLTDVSAPPAHVGQWNASARVTSLVRSVLACDAWLSLGESRIGWSLPGLSWWALCRKAGDDCAN